MGYYNLKQFELSQGTDLDFNYQFDREIPVLIGIGLSKTYPVSWYPWKVDKMERAAVKVM